MDRQTDRLQHFYVNINTRQKDTNTSTAVYLQTKKYFR